MSSIKVILVDDHRLVRDGIKALIADAKNIEIVAEAGDGYELLEKLKEIKVNIVVLDISLPKMNGIEVMKILKSHYPDIKILVLSMFTNEEFIYNSLKAGASGYLPKNTTRVELLEAIYTINNGGEYFSNSITDIILKSYVRNAKSGEKTGENKLHNLSSRELEILRLFAEGQSNQQIAESLYISTRTVESHKNHIMQKLELKTTVDLLKFAIRNNIIEL
jgi:DNA-binding NarL/FixJ family response regulator